LYMRVDKGVPQEARSICLQTGAHHTIDETREVIPVNVQIEVYPDGKLQ